MKKIKLDKEEQDLLDSIDRGEWKSVKNLKREIKRHQDYARNTLKKDKRVNIRISSKDLEEIQSMEAELAKVKALLSWFRRLMSGSLYFEQRDTYSRRRAESPVGSERLPKADWPP